MKSYFSRRDFLKVSSLALGGLAFAPYLPPTSEFDDGFLVRVASNQLSVYSKPTDESLIVGQVYRDDILHVYEEVNSGTPGYNPVWYRVWGGYVHRARLPKVQVMYNAPHSLLRKEGQFAEVTVPFTMAMTKTTKGWKPNYRLYYETVHWLVGIDEGPDGTPWYRILDELNDLTYNAPAAHFRLITDEEFTPISPDVPWEDKKITVDLQRQVLVCYEGNEPVFTTSIASGRLNSNPGPNGIPTKTPTGDAQIVTKMPSKHMGNGSLFADPDAYELPGVPWTSFFKYEHLPFQGHAFHGTYWHDNFGVPMSSGCINMRNHEAKWLFRWCLPSAPMADINTRTLDRKGYGTRIIMS